MNTKPYYGKHINVRMFGMSQPAYNLRIVSEPKRVMVHVDGIVVRVLYTCTVQFNYETLRVYLSTWDMFEDTIELQYWDTAQTVDQMWLELLVDRELAQTVIDLTEKQ